MSALLDDSKYKDLFGKAIEAIKELLHKESMKGIHAEVRKVIAVLTGQPIDKKVDVEHHQQQQQPIPHVSLPGTSIANLLLDFSEDAKVEQPTLVPAPAKKVEDQPVKPVPQPPKTTTTLLIDFPTNDKSPTLSQLPIDILKTNSDDSQGKQEESMFGNSGINKGGIPEKSSNEIIGAKLIPVLSNDDRDKREPKCFDFIDDEFK